MSLSEWSQSAVSWNTAERFAQARAKASPSPASRLRGHSADFRIFLSLKKFDLFYFFISYSSCDEESIHQRIFFYVERDVCNKMLKFCAFYNFFSSFFHLNYCAGYTYHVKIKKMTKRQRIFFSFEWCVSNCKKKLPSCSYLLFKIVFLMASVSNLVF